MGRSRLGRQHERRALAKAPAKAKRKPVRQRLSSSGKPFWRAKAPGQTPNVEHIRDVFRRVLEGTNLGRRLGYGS